MGNKDRAGARLGRLLLLAGLATAAAWAGRPQLDSVSGLADSLLAPRPLQQSAEGETVIPVHRLMDSELAWAQPRSATPTATLVLSTLTRFRYRISGPPVPAQELKVTALGEEVEFEASALADWVRLDRGRGKTPDKLLVSADGAKLTPGTYTSTITVTAPSALRLDTYVILDVLASNVLAIDQDTVRFDHTRGGTVPANRSVRVESGGEPLDFTVTAVSTGNWLTVTPLSGKTPANLSVGIVPGSIGAGTYTGLVTVQAPGAPNSPLSFQVVMQVSGGTAPAIRSNGVVNAASAGQEIAPGSWVSLYGENLSTIPAPGRSWAADDFSGDQLPTTLEGVSVRINGKPAAVSYVSGSQLNIQAPDDTAEGVVPVEVTTPAGVARGTVQLRRIAPAMFVRGLGTARPIAAAVHLDGVPLGRPESETGTRAARPGDTVVFFGTGFGATNPPRPAGRLVQAAPLASAFTVLVGGVPATAQYGGLIGVGLYQFNVVIPELSNGDHAVVIETAGRLTQPDVFLPVRR